MECCIEIFKVSIHFNKTVSVFYGKERSIEWENNDKEECSLYLLALTFSFFFHNEVVSCAILCNLKW